MAKKKDEQNRESDNKPESNKNSVDEKSVQEVKKDVAKTEQINALKVECHFPAIMDLKQAIGSDADGNLVLQIQFKTKLDQYELFRLANLLKQPHGVMYANLGSLQSAMDFKFTTDGKIEILKAEKAAERKDIMKELSSGDKVSEIATEKAVKIHSVTFNHIKDEKLPYGVLIESVFKSGEMKSFAGRGKNPTEAVISGIHTCGAVPVDIVEPSAIRESLETLEPSGDLYKIIRVIDTGSFDVTELKGK